MNKLLLTILIFGFILRFYALGQVPISLHRDEAFLGYNAYSILNTGNDISGNFLPLHLESFLFSPAGYSYFSIPFIYLFNLNEFSIRFASAFFGFLTIPVIYFLTKLLLNQHKDKVKIALFSTFIFSISPWHVNLSRTATENTLATFFITIGALIFILWLNRKKVNLLLLSFLSFAISLAIYQAPRPFLPIFMPFMAIILGAKFLKREILLPLILFLTLILIPVFLIVTSPQLSYRIRTLNIFEHPQTQIMVTSWLIGDNMNRFPDFLSRPFHNKVVGYSQVFAENFFNHLSPSFLFFDKGLPDRYRIPQSGLLYLFEIALLFVAVIYLAGKSIKLLIFLLGWILISFIGSSLTFDDIPNLQRTLTALPPLSILSGIGLFVVSNHTRSKKLGKYFVFGLALVIFYSLCFYLVQYYSYSKVYRPWYRQDGYRELVAKVNLLKSSYKDVIITNRETAPTIFFLLYNKYNPALFQNQTKNIDFSKTDYASFSDYKFTDEECPLKIDEISKKLIEKKGVLYINSGLCKDVQGTNLIHTVKRSDGSAVFKLIEVN